MTRFILALVLLACVVPACVAPARAQAYVHDARAAVPIPALLGRGDAGVAVATRETAFFVNPAHVAATAGGFHLTLAGVGVGLTPSVLGVVERIRDEADGLDGYDECDTDGDGIPDDLCNAGGGSTSDAVGELLGMARRPAELRGTVLLPSFSFRAGNVGASGGLFAHSRLRVQAAETARGDSLYTFMQTDGIAAATLSGVLPEAVTEAVGKVTLGAGVRAVRRYATLYDLDPDDLEALDDPALVAGAAVAVDVGALWETPVDGLDAALAVYDVGGTMDYAPSDFFGLIETDGASAQARRIGTALAGRDGRASFRVGVAYRPLLPLSAPVVTLAADVVSASTTGYRQSLPGHVRLGAEALVAGRIGLRAGLAGGGPSLGATLDLVAVKLDYALFAQPSGRIPGEDGGVRHALLLRLGLD